MKAVRLLTATAFATMVLSAAPKPKAASPKAAPDGVEYVAGTVETPAPNTKGAIDTAATGMKFQYASSVFEVPYDRLASVEQGRPGGIAGKLKKVVTLSRKSHFTVAFKDDKGALQTMTFAAGKQQVAKTVPALQAKVTKPQPGDARAAVAPAQQAEAWWGDRYWKTDRNLNKWPGSASSNQ